MAAKGAENMGSASAIRWLTFVDIQPELAVAQSRALQTQAPLLYALLSVNMVAVAYTHLGLAPDWMAIWIPALLVSANMLRMVSWLRKRGQSANAAESVALLRRTSVLSAVLSLIYITWALGLSHFGGDREQTHVAIFIAITVVGCIFCLMPLPQAALGVTVIVTVPYLAYYFSKCDAVYAAIGINILLVTVVMVYVLLNTYRDFVENVRSKVKTERLNREITLLAHTDALTGLPNRRLFFSDLSQAIDQARATGTDLALGIVDLDRFKAVNDTMGHFLGDRLLETVAARFKAHFPDDGTVSRLGGDEFAFQIRSSGAEAVNIANKICEVLSEPYEVGGATVSIGASCGIATLSSIGTGQGGGSLYDAADYALYSAKGHRRGFATLYSAEHENRIRSERAMEAALQMADLDAEIDVHFQPIMGPGGRTLIAVEALARWTSPTMGRVGPDIFIPLAERTGIVHRLTQILFKKALAVAERMPCDIKLSFNLSAHDLISPATILALVAAIRTSAVTPSRIIFELTETAVMRDFSAAEDSIRMLRSLGVQIALDDFGTGQSSLSHLRLLPIDKVKIDRSFVADADRPEGYDLLAAIIALCAKMKISCVAEGVETARQLDILLNLGCNEFQGYHFSKPLPAEAILQWAKVRAVA